jgi:hypothetical protein
MRHLLTAALIVAAMSSCKKDASTPNGGTTPPTDNITLAKSDLLLTFAPNKTLTTQLYIPDGIMVPGNSQSQTWDFSNLTSIGSTKVDQYTAVQGTFPNASYSSPLEVTYIDGSLQTEGLAYEVSDSGYCRWGSYCPAINLNIPGTATFDYAAQSSSFATRMYLTPIFPVKYGDTRSYSVSRSQAFTVDAPAYGLNKTPASQKFSSAGTTTAWATGKVKLPGTTSYINVIVIKNYRKTIYNYFLNGAPAPKALLDVLGVTDNETFTTTWYDFYNPNGKGYVASLQVSDSGAVYNLEIVK